MRGTFPNGNLQYSKLCIFAEKFNMKNPFQYGKIAEKDNFIDRNEDRAFLKQALYSGINVILISPRRWGKSSLVNKAIQELCEERKDVRVCYIDAFPITSSAEFYRIFTKEVLKSTASHWQNIMDSVGKFLKTISPKVSFSTDQVNEFSISFDMSGNAEDEIEILNLPEKIAKEKGFQMIICIDEFQKLAKLDNYDHLESQMRSVWQHQQNTSYCLYGSQRHMMDEIFDSSEKPFYRFGQMYRLNKIETADWVKYIIERFEFTGKQISPTLAEKIVEIVDRHSWYVQQLASAVWNFTATRADEAAFEKGFIWCVDVNSEVYRNVCDSLLEFQVNLLKAIANNEQQLSSVNTLRKYRLGTSASVTKNKKILLNMDIINVSQEKIEFQDLLFKVWFAKKFIYD